MKIKIWLSLFLLLTFYLLPLTHWSNVSEIWFSFCDETQKNKVINIQAWWTYDLCLNFFSRSSDKIQIKYWFSKWFVKNSNWLQLCDQDMWPNNDFSKLFSSDSWNSRTLIVPPQWFAKIHETIKAPIWSNWMVYGCLVFKSSKIDNSKAWWMFNIIERKSSHLNLIIWNASDIKSSIQLLPNKSDIYSSNKNIKVQLINNKSSISFLLKNDWNISQQAKVQWRIYNILWFEKTFQTENYIIAPSTTTEIKQEIWLIPAYKWPFKVSFEINYSPYIDFQWDNIDPSLKKSITITETSTIFIFSWIWVILTIIILSIITITFKPLFKKS